MLLCLVLLILVGGGAVLAAGLIMMKNDPNSSTGNTCVMIGILIWALPCVCCVIIVQSIQGWMLCTRCFAWTRNNFPNHSWASCRLLLKTSSPQTSSRDTSILWVFLSWMRLWDSTVSRAPWGFLYLHAAQAESHMALDLFYMLARADISFCLLSVYMGYHMNAKSYRMYWYISY